MEYYIEVLAALNLVCERAVCEDCRRRELCKELGVKPLGEDWIRRYRAAGGTGHNTANMVRIVYNDSKGMPKVAFSRIFIRNKHPQKI